MAFLQVQFYSDTLTVASSVYVILPEPRQGIGMKAAAADEPPKVLYLLHGYSDDHTIWMRRTSVERYAAEYNLAVIMPAVNHSFYTNEAQGEKYWDYVSEELPEVMHRFFRLSKKPEDTYVAGLSMGGYGAMKLGLTRPGRYAAVASLSGALDMLGNYERRKKINPDYLAEMDDIYGSEKQLKNGKGNLNRLADKLAKTPEKAPKMYVACGTEDFLFAANEGFHARYGKVFDMEYHTEPGIHNWPFWNRHIERVLAWLPLEKAKEEE